MHNTDDHVVAPGTAYDRPHPMHVGSKRRDRASCAALRTGHLGHSHLKRKNLAQNAAGGVAIQFLFHHEPPVGPKRSVFTRAGSYPSGSKPAAAGSTICVEPQMNASGCCSLGKATSCSSTLSILRRYPVPPGGWERVPVWIASSPA